MSSAISFWLLGSSLHCHPVVLHYIAFFTVSLDLKWVTCTVHFWPTKSITFIQFFLSNNSKMFFHSCSQQRKLFYFKKFIGELLIFSYIIFSSNHTHLYILVITALWACVIISQSIDGVSDQQVTTLLCNVLWTISNKFTVSEFHFTACTAFLMWQYLSRRNFWFIKIRLWTLLWIRISGWFGM
jgi:hypothetical protein